MFSILPLQLWYEIMKLLYTRGCLKKIKTCNNFLDYYMTLNEKVINYKILVLVNFYNFIIKFDFIRNHMKNLRIYLCGTICRVVMPSATPENYF